MSEAALEAEALAIGRHEYHRILVGTIVTAFIGTVFTVARLYTRVIITKNQGKDDLFLLIAWISAAVLTALNCILGQQGTVEPKINPLIPLTDNFNYIAILSYACQAIYQFVLWATKISLCFFYLRIFDGSMRWTLYILITLLTVAFASIELLFIFRCRPISDAWNYGADRGPTCLSIGALVFASAITNIIGDLFLMAIVIPHFVRIKLPIKQKAILVFIVALGFLVVTASIIRLLRVINDETSLAAGADITIWSSVEVNVSIFCASAPSVRPIFRKIAPGCLALTGRNKMPRKNEVGIHISTQMISRPTQRGIELSDSSEEFAGQSSRSSSTKTWVKDKNITGDDFVEEVAVRSLESVYVRLTVQVSMDQDV